MFRSFVVVEEDDYMLHFVLLKADALRRSPWIGLQRAVRRACAGARRRDLSCSTGPAPMGASNQGPGEGERNSRPIAVASRLPRRWEDTEGEGRSLAAEGRRTFLLLPATPRHGSCTTQAVAAALASPQTASPLNFTISENLGSERGGARPFLVPGPTFRSRLPNTDRLFLAVICRRGLVVPCGNSRRTEGRLAAQLAGLRLP